MRRNLNTARSRFRAGRHRSDIASESASWRESSEPVKHERHQAKPKLSKQSRGILSGTTLSGNQKMYTGLELAPTTGDLRAGLVRYFAIKEGCARRTLRRRRATIQVRHPLRIASKGVLRVHHGETENRPGLVQNLLVERRATRVPPFAL